MDHLPTEARNPASFNLDELTPLELVHLMNAEDSQVIPAVASQAEPIAKAIEIIAERLRAGGRLVYAGAGTSGRLGVLDATECPPTFNAPPGQVLGVIAGGPPALTQAVEGAEDHPEFAKRDLAAIGLNSKDVLVGIATSGRTPYVLGAVDYARKQGVYAIGLACNPESDLGSSVHLAITVVVGPEVLSGSTRLKAGTATKLVLNMLTTGAMVRLGKTHGDLMVDLRATNSKLRARANRMVRLLTGLSQPDAAELLVRCNGEVKTSLVTYLADVPPPEARRRLEEAGGRVGKALAGSEPHSRVALARVAQPVQTLLLGIDGGGTRTLALLARAEASSDPTGRWSVLGRGEAGPSNVKAVGVKGLQALDEAVRRAFAAAALPRQTVRAACLGLAGADRVEDQKLIHDWARRVYLAAQVEVTSDAAILLAAGTPAGWGIAIIAGTGSIAYGRSPDGRTARAGGWGYFMGDEGSGYVLVQTALQAITRAADGRGPVTNLTEAFLHKLNLKRPQELITTLYGNNWDRTTLAALAPLVLTSAETGDAIATAIVEEGANQLAQTTAAVARQLGLTETAIPLAMTGGLLLSNAAYRRRILDALHSLGLQADSVQLVNEPAEGSLRLALLRSCQ